MTQVPSLLDVATSINDTFYQRFGGNSSPKPVAYTEEAWRASRPPKPVHLVKDLIVSDSVVFMHSEPGAGKSTLVQDLAVAFMSGGTWFGRQCVQSRVAFLMFEAANTMQHRLDAAFFVRGVESREDVADYLILDAPPLSQTAAYAVMGREFTRGGIGVVVVDTLTAATLGMDIHGGSSDDPTAVVRALTALCPKGGTVIVLHHPGKAGGSTMAGSAVFERAMDTEIHLQRKKGEPVGVISVRKQRSLRDHYELGRYEMVPVKDRDGDEVITVRDVTDRKGVTSETPKPAVKTAKAVSPEQKVWEYLDEHPEASANEVYKALGGRRGDVMNAVKAWKEISA